MWADWMQGKTAAVTPGKITEFLQPVRVWTVSLGSSILTGSQLISSSSPGPPWVHWPPAEQESYGASESSPPGSAVPSPIPGRCTDSPVPPALLIQSHGKPLLPAQGDGIAGDKDKPLTIFLEDTGGAVHSQRSKVCRPRKGHHNEQPGSPSAPPLPRWCPFD